MIRIRVADKEDAPSLEGIDNAWKEESISSGLIPRTQKKFLKIIKEGAVVVVAENDGKVIGYTCGVVKKAARPSPNGKNQYLDLDSAYVLKQYRNRGIGKRLVKKLIDITKKKNLDTIWLTADSLELQRLINFYKCLNFKTSYIHMKYDIK